MYLFNVYNIFLLVAFTFLTFRSIFIFFLYFTLTFLHLRKVSIVKEHGTTNKLTLWMISARVIVFMQ